MTDQEIQDTYGELESMFVPVDADASRGLGYVREKITMCRAMQDRLVDVQLRTNRALSAIEQDILTLRLQQDIAPDGPTKQKLHELESRRARHTYLVKSVKLQAGLLRSTTMDLRLLADLTKEQIKLGEINPHEAGLVKEQSPGDIPPQSFSAPVPNQNEPVFSEPTQRVGQKAAAPAPAPMSIFEGMNGFNDPTIPPAPDRLVVPETGAVSFDSIFDRQEASHHVEHSAGSPF